MAFIDFILNLAGLLLWVNWRAEQLDAKLRAPVISLAGTLKRAGSSPIHRWRFLFLLGGLLLVRPLLYRAFGPAAQATLTLDLVTMVLPFRTNDALLMLLYSFLSFLFTLTFFYLALLLLSLVNGNLPDTDPLHRLVRLHLGRVERLPALLKWMLPGLAGFLFWIAFCHLAARLELLPGPRSIAEWWQQGIVIGLGVYLNWRDVIVGALVLHLVNCYVYLGRSPVWTYVQTTGHRLLLPLSALPLRAGKVNFTPIVGMALVFLIAQIIRTGFRLPFTDARMQGLLPWLFQQIPF